MSSCSFVSVRSMRGVGRGQVSGLILSHDTTYKSRALLAVPRDRAMDYYQIWVDLKDAHRDIEFCANVDKYLGHLRQKGMVEAWTISRRKLGFGPQDLGDFNVTIAVRDLVQLEQMFQY